MINPKSFSTEKIIYKKINQVSFLCESMDFSISIDLELNIMIFNVLKLQLTDIWSLYHGKNTVACIY